MIGVVQSTTVRADFKNICNQVFAGDTLIIARPQNENIVMISEKRYQELEKAERNAAFLARLDESYEQVKSGKIVTHDLVEVD